MSHKYKPYHQREDRNLFAEFVENEAGDRAPTYQNWRIVIRGVVVLLVLTFLAWYEAGSDEDDPALLQHRSAATTR